MDWLNYHHLLYFYSVAREGSVKRASEVLHLAQPTLSGQIRKLEEALGEKLFRRRGRGLELTPAGQIVYDYAASIFTLGDEMVTVLRGQRTSRPSRLVVGISDTVPKLISYKLLEPILRAEEPVQLVLKEGKTDALLADLALQSFDLVLTDAPVGTHVRVRAYNHLLGECGITFFASPELVERHRSGFPGSLDGAPMLLPTDNTMLRRSLDQWFHEIGIQPRIVAEIEDSALLKVFGHNGEGIFPAPEIMGPQIRSQHHVRSVGFTGAVQERFYAITVERRIQNPLVASITKSARDTLFS